MSKISAPAPKNAVDGVQISSDSSSVRLGAKLYGFFGVDSEARLLSCSQLRFLKNFLVTKMSLF